MSPATSQAVSRIERHSGTLQFGNKRITFHLWAHTDGVTPVDTVLFMGSAQVGKIPKWAAQAAPAGTVVVEGLPHWQARPTADDLGKLTHDYTVAAFQTVLDRFNLTSAHIIGMSQSTVGVIWLAKEQPSLIRNVACVGPLGLTANMLGDSPEARVKELKKRTLRTYLQLSQSPLHDLRILYMQWVLLRSILSETEWGATDKKYSLGLSYDLLEDCRIVAQERRKQGQALFVFVAEKDKIFPPHEVLASLKKACITEVHTSILKGISHPSLATRGNKKALVQIVNRVRNRSLAPLTM